MKCRECVHWGICEYSTIADKEIKCKDFIFKKDYIKIVRCKDCDVPHNKYTGCPKLGGLVTLPDFYCAWGRPKITEDIL
jgi:hypothetical protein